MMQADIEFLKTGYDNWNGGIELWTVYLRVPVKVFVSIENVHEHIARLISQYLELVVGKDNGYWTSAEIKPLRAPPPASSSRAEQLVSAPVLPSSMRCEREKRSGFVI